MAREGVLAEGLGSWRGSDEALMRTHAAITPYFNGGKATCRFLGNRFLKDGWNSNLDGYHRDYPNAFQVVR